MKELQTLPTLPAGFTGNNSTAEIQTGARIDPRADVAEFARSNVRYAASRSLV